MHMADALVSPAVGGAMWVASAGLLAYGAKKLNEEADERKVPLMGVTAAFVFAAQMINFTIPGTGSSGHLGGGLLLAVLLGPWAALLTLASVLTVQALFFADGGLLALGCNIFNMGFFPILVFYPLLYRPLTGNNPSRGRIVIASVLTAVLGLQFGALGVVLQTWLSGISELPIGTFLWMMQPIHLAIGLVEGLATAAVILFVHQARPEILDPHAASGVVGHRSWKPVIVGFVVTAIVTGALLSWFASSLPDGLEWSMAKTSGKEELDAPKDGLHGSLASLQESTSVLPDYGFAEHPAEAAQPADSNEEAWPAVEAGTSLSGLVGSAITLLIAGLLGWILRRKHARR